MILRFNFSTTKYLLWLSQFSFFSQKPFHKGYWIIICCTLEVMDVVQHLDFDICAPYCRLIYYFYTKIDFEGIFSWWYKCRFDICNCIHLKFLNFEHMQLQTIVKILHVHWQKYIQTLSWYVNNMVHECPSSKLRTLLSSVFKVQYIIVQNSFS